MHDELDIGGTNFRDHAEECLGNKPLNTPALFAHFLEQSLGENICFEDVINNQTGALKCAPGPFMINEGTVVDVSENEWRLLTMPSYFIWQLGKNDGSLVEERFYITNQNGFPIKSHAIKLQKDGEATVVLIPKSEFLPGVKYYAYLVLNTENSQETWIQPLSLSSQKKPAPRL